MRQTMSATFKKQRAIESRDRLRAHAENIQGPPGPPAIYVLTVRSLAQGRYVRLLLPCLGRVSGLPYLVDITNDVADLLEKPRRQDGSLRIASSGGGWSTDRKELHWQINQKTRYANTAGGPFDLIDLD